MSGEELRRRGPELQSAVPEPSGGATRGHRWKEERRAELDLAHGTADLGASLGFLGIILAVPGLAIWAFRGLRRWVDQTQ